MKDREDVAKRLAQAHYRIEPAITQIFTIWDKPEYETLPNSPIKLLEVNENTIPSGIMPLRFDPVPASGISYPSVIVEVTPDEYEKIQNHELKLPEGWRIGIPLPRPAAGNGME